MCGICLILSIPIDNHHFNFDFFKSYNHKNEEILPLNKHIQNNKLMLNKNFNLQQIVSTISRRGPDKCLLHEIDLYKTNFKEILPTKQESNVEKGFGIGIQSILHLRGNQPYAPQCPGSYFLYNGQIWDTGSLSPIDEESGENDAKWLHRTLSECKGSEQKMLEVLNQIRGDFSIILLEGDQLFLIKDYFGKRSLLIGMSEDHLILTSSPVDNLSIDEEQNNNENANEDENEQSWKTKYQAEWLSSKNKQFFQTPANSLISINLRNGEAFWSHYTIIKTILKDIPKQIQTEQFMIANIKKLLIQSLRELTKCVKGFQKGKSVGKLEGSKIAILFSGGIDSTLIARILDIVLPKQEEIDLINLSFREDAPDRQSGKISFKQLQGLNPDRKFNLILVDKTLNDAEGVKKQLLSSIYPKTTHMDFNIAAALHLASKATTAKIVLTGLGADQIFAGYSRYRIAYKRAGFEQLQNQMIFDMQRLWIRNLGRDDRAIGMNGKQARYPFLYLPLWTYLRTIQINKLTEGNGEKMLLRKIAREFGLQKASTFKKKAIQFGTRLAKLSNVKSFGSNRKAKGTFQYK